MKVAVAAGRTWGVRAALALDAYTAREMVEHDDVTAEKEGT